MHDYIYIKGEFPRAAGCIDTQPIACIAFKICASFTSSRRECSDSVLLSKFVVVGSCVHRKGINGYIF